MSKLVSHLSKHLDGEVVDEPTVLEHFAIDGSIFRIPPRVVVYPRHTIDIRKAVRFCWMLAEKGHHLPITARGKGTDRGGAAIGPGMIIALTAHMNRLLGFDKTDVAVEPGMIFGDLERILHSHGRFLPPYPASFEYSTIGGAVANNASGLNSLKYGQMKDYVKSLEVVLANGQLIRAQKLSAKELSNKKGQTDFEGEVYRQLDGLLDDNKAPIAQAQARFKGVKNVAGYNLWDIKAKDGSFDLSKLICGAQGTLGIISSVTLTTVAYNSKTYSLLAFFDDTEALAKATQKLKGLKPSALELLDRSALELIHRHQPQKLEGMLGSGLPRFILLAQFDDDKERARSQKAKKCAKLLDGLATQIKLSDNDAEQAGWWSLAGSAHAVLWQDQAKKPIPIIEDVAIPPENSAEFIDEVQSLLKKHGQETFLTGHAGDGHFHLQPLFDLGGVGDRQAFMKLMDEVYELVTVMGGSTTGQHNDGRLRAPYLEALYGKEMYELFGKVKQIFDPYNILNPGVKLDFGKDEMVAVMRHEYSLPHLFDHFAQLS